MTLKFIHNRKNKLNQNSEALIHLRITHERIPRYFSTGIYVEPKHWNENKCRVKNHNMATYLNAKITEIEQKALTYYHSTENFDPARLIQHLSGKTESKGTALAYFWKLFDGYENNLSENTMKQHRLMLNFLSKYDKHIEFKDIDYSFKKSFEDWLLNQNSKRGGKLSRNYVALMLRLLKGYTNEAMRQGKIKADPFMGEKIKTAETKKDFLTGSELEKIESLDVSHRRGNIPESKDMFLFSCYTGLRFSDLIELTPDHFRHDGEGLRLRKVLKKTKKNRNEIDLPLYMLFEGRPERLIKKYLEADRVYDELFGPYNQGYNGHYNTHLKMFADLAGIDKHISAHVSRHTCAMILLNEYGLSFEIVQKILGHQSIATTQRHYAKMLTRGLDDRLRKAFNDNKKINL